MLKEPKKLVQIVLTAISIIVLIIYLNNWSTTNKAERQAIDYSLDSLKFIIQDYKNLQTNYDNKIIELNDSIAYLNALIEYNDQQITDLKKKRHGKAINISKYSTADIKKFWSDRYKDSLQSK
jgi:uncharacterized protein YoxC